MFSRLRKGRKDGDTPQAQPEPTERKRSSGRQSGSSRKSNKGRSSRRENTEDDSHASSVTSNSRNKSYPPQDPYSHAQESPNPIEEGDYENGGGQSAEAKFLNYFNQKRTTDEPTMPAVPEPPANSYLPDTWGDDFDEDVYTSGDHLEIMASASKKKEREERERKQREAEEEAQKQKQEANAAPDMSGMSAEEQRKAKARQAVEDRKRKAREAVAARKAKAKASTRAKAGIVSDDDEDIDDGIAAARSEEAERREIEEEKRRTETANSEKKRLMEEAEAARKAQKEREEREAKERELKLAQEEETLKRQQMELYQEELRLEEELKAAEERAKEEEELRRLEEEERKLNEEMAQLEAEAKSLEEAEKAQIDAQRAAEEEAAAASVREVEARLEEEKRKAEEVRLAAEKLTEEQALQAEIARVAAEKLAAEQVESTRVAAEKLAAEKSATSIAAQDVEASETELSALLDNSDAMLDSALENSPTPVSPSKSRGGLRSSLTRMLSGGKNKSTEKAKKVASPARHPKASVSVKSVASASPTVSPTPKMSKPPVPPPTKAKVAEPKPIKSRTPDKTPDETATPKRSEAPQESLPPAARPTPSKPALKVENTPKIKKVKTQATPSSATSHKSSLVTPARATSGQRPSPASQRAFPNSPARSVDSTGSVASIDHIPRSPYMKVTDGQEYEPVCKNPYQPLLHATKGACQICVFRLSGRDLARFEKNGRSLLVNTTAGGCIDCQAFPSQEEEDPVRICKKCFFDTHLPPDRQEEAFSGLGPLAGASDTPKHGSRRSRFSM